MVREVIRPQQTDLHIKIPTEYLNREIEFIMFPLDERQSIKNSDGVNIESLGGVFSKYAGSSKRELEDKAWEIHIADKYK